MLNSSQNTGMSKKNLDDAKSHANLQLVPHMESKTSEKYTLDDRPYT